MFKKPITLCYHTSVGTELRSPASTQLLRRMASYLKFQYQKGRDRMLRVCWLLRLALLRSSEFTYERPPSIIKVDSNRGRLLTLNLWPPLLSCIHVLAHTYIHTHNKYILVWKNRAFNISKLKQDHNFIMWRELTTQSDKLQIGSNSFCWLF